MSPETPRALELTRRLVAREATEGDSADHAAASAHAACERAYRTLARWLGANGSHALFSRALSHAQAERPEIRDIRVRARSEAALEGVSESIEAHGAAAVAAGLESLLVTLLDLLGRLIGDDMAARLLEQRDARTVSRQARNDAPNGESPR